jgi:transposase InsO family protein
VSAFINEHRVRFGVEPICREIEVSASAYWARKTRPPSLRAQRDEYLLGAIKRVHAGSGGVYGQLKVWDELTDENITVARCTVERLMRASGIEGPRNGHVIRTTLPGLSPVAADDLVRRNFSADRPDAIWLSDFTYIRTWEGWSYLSVVLDVHTRRIVGSAARQSHAPEPGKRCSRDGHRLKERTRSRDDRAFGQRKSIYELRIHRAPEEGRHRPQPGKDRDGAR